MRCGTAETPAPTPSATAVWACSGLLERKLLCALHCKRTHFRRVMDLAQLLCWGTSRCPVDGKVQAVAKRRLQLSKDTLHHGIERTAGG